MYNNTMSCIVEDCGIIRKLHENNFLTVKISE